MGKEYVSDAQRRAVHATRADGGKGNPNKMLSPTNFNRALFGSMGMNPSVNALTNANAIAAQQMPQIPSLPQQPVNPAVGVYGRPDMRAQLMGVGSNLSPMMKHADEEVKSLKAEIKTIRAQYENEEKEGEFYEDPNYEKARARLAVIEEEHKNK